MGLRNSADVRTLLWVAAAPVVVGIQYARPELVPYLAPLSCYLALSCGIFAHNHNHCPTFETKRGNQLFAMVLSVFYGYPTFAWVPTHNLNHHKFVNRAGDATITWRYSDKHNLFVALTYFFVSSYWQSEPIKDYIRKARAKNPKLFRTIVTQYVVWGGTVTALLATGIALHGLKTGLFTWVFATMIPSIFALWTIMWFNYEQHVRTDPWSKHDHSRNFTGGAINFLLFNNGLHGVHHEHPGAHWSSLRGYFSKIENEIHPDLRQSNLFVYVLRTYFLALVMKRFESKQIGRAPFNPPTGEKVDLTTAEVMADESGTNAPMLVS